MLSVISLLGDLVRFPSLSREEEAIASYVEAYVRRSHLPVRRVGNNVWFALGAGAHRLLLNSHLDVVPPSSGHPYPPFDPVVVNGRLYGRGAVDAKASGAAMTTAVLELAAAGYEPTDGSVLVALTVCEEIGQEHNGLRALRPQLPEIHAALVGEPTDMQPMVAQKGMLVLRAAARGRSAHAARAELGENAILKAARDISRLDTLEFDRADPVLGKSSLAVTTISGGSARNIVPETCTFEIDIRSTPAYTHKEIISLVTDLLESEVAVHSARIVPVSTRSDEPIVRSCLAAIPESVPRGSPTASDWLYLADIPTVKIGPGSSELSHTADEHIVVSDLEYAVAAYKRIIESYFEDHRPKADSHPEPPASSSQAA